MYISTLGDGGKADDALPGRERQQEEQAGDED